MKITKIKILFCSICILQLVSCTNTERELNQSILISEDVQKETEPTLKVISNDKIYLDNVLECNSKIVNNENNELIIIENLYKGDFITDISYYKINIKGNNGECKLIETVTYLPHDYSTTSGNKYFLIKDLGKDKVEIVPFDNLNSYVVDKNIIFDEASMCVLGNNELVKITSDNGKSIIKFYELLNSTIDEFELPSSMDTYLWRQTSDNKMLLAMNWNLASCSWDTIGVLDIESKEIEQETKVDEFCGTYSIDENRIVLLLANGGINIYDVKNKVQKKFLDYDSFRADFYYNTRENKIFDFGVFSEKDKIYFTVVEDNIIKVKVAVLNGTEIEESVTVYEVSNEGEVPVPNITLTNDDKEMIIYHNDTNYFTKIKLSK